MRNESTEEKKVTTDFDAIRLSLASPEEILEWSHGEVTKPETINYRTQKPERDGLFCERIFGPTKDWECYCGKYKKIRYKGIVCDKCGVEVTRSIVRRERMGHIELAAPVSHIWFLRGVPSRLGLVLGMSVRDLERVIYFASFIITDVEKTKKEEILKKLKLEFEEYSRDLKKEYERKIKEAKPQSTDGADSKQFWQKELEQKLVNIKKAYEDAVTEINSVKKFQIISESKLLDLEEKYGTFFNAEIGAEAILKLIKEVNIEKTISSLRKEAEEAIGQRKKKLIKRLRLFEGFRRAGINPEWMILRRIAVIPPDLRPMVQLDGGRFAASDLNDLYRRVINRNNRLKRLIELEAPEVIKRNEKRMLQEAVDALIDNEARRGKVVATVGSKRKLKSLSDILKGKQGRFRQNLLGKRVDYSGRSVIVVGPALKLYQCGIPKQMALELFKPFIAGQLIKRGFAHNVKAASKLIEQGSGEVWDILEEITRQHLVLLNRAPTLHRLGIQAFQLVLIEGKAIQIHPLVCAAFNADFDGDQMAVHVPISAMAQEEASEIMLSSKNLLKPAAGEPVVAPTQDMILGCFYLTLIREGAKGEGKHFSSSDEALMAYQLDEVDIQAKIKVKFDDGLRETSVGRIIFNSILPKGIDFVDQVMDKKGLRKIVAEVFSNCGGEEAARFVDEIKKLGFEFATKAGFTISITDIIVPETKKNLVTEAEKKIEEIKLQFKKGLITEEERYLKTLSVWTRTTEAVEKTIVDNFSHSNPVHAILSSGARGSISQLTQLAGMKGLVVNPAGQTIELPVKANFKEGLSVLEYFISTHGARKGRSDIALRTADAGYLTRRLVDVCQDIVITSSDCGTKNGIRFSKTESEEAGESFTDRIMGRVLLKPALDSKSGEVLLEAGTLISETNINQILERSDAVEVRSPLTCEKEWGICQQCYGRNLATGRLVDLGEAVGIIAAQSIGEPGTQLTMRTFHTGGVVGLDITQGLPRVEELFEARSPRSPAVISEITGRVAIRPQGNQILINVTAIESEKDEYPLGGGYKSVVKVGEKVIAKQVLAKAPGKKAIRAKNPGEVKIEKDKIIVVHEGLVSKLYTVSSQIDVIVRDGDFIKKGQALTEGHLDLQMMLALVGKREVEKYIIKEVQGIYASQGQSINDKHLEIVIRQMFSKIKIVDPGSTDYLPGEIVNKWKIMKENISLIREKKVPVKTEDLLLGVTKVALYTDSFLSAASFQETTSILIEAAITGKIDRLKGLKENTIIGKLIPAGTGFRSKFGPEGVK